MRKLTTIPPGALAQITGGAEDQQQRFDRLWPQIQQSVKEVGQLPQRPVLGPKLMIGW